MLHIYYGKGKGKTTASIGLAVRAAGRNKKVLFAQFLKNEDTGERPILAQISGIELMKCPKELKFVCDMNEDEKNLCRQFCSGIFDLCVRQVLVGHYDMVVFDEIFSAIENKMLTESELFDFIANAPKNIEIVLTGHNPGEKILSLADYATEMKKIAHPYDKGIDARKGIEY